MLIAGSSAILFLPLLLIFMLRPDKNNLSADPAAAIPGYQMLIEKNVGKTPEPATFSEKKPSGTSSKPSPATKVKHTAPERTLKKTALNKGNGFFTPKKQIKPSEDNKAQSRLKIKKIGSTHSTFETDNFKIIVEHRKEEYQKEETPLLKELRGVNEIHTVVKGDTLWHIAILYLGDPLLYPAIAELSRINNPDLIYPGDKIYLIRK
ncbi:MAG: LysM peptidoglycan-binding domain-containing protein [bacterium]|nr:LysM peptidoglycan-binding domain-containing protein [bacterium]